MVARAFFVAGGVMAGWTASQALNAACSRCASVTMAWSWPETGGLALQTLLVRARAWRTMEEDEDEVGGAATPGPVVDEGTEEKEEEEEDGAAMEMGLCSCVCVLCVWWVVG